MKVEQIYTKCLAQGSYYIESNGEAVVIDPLRDVSHYLDLAKKSKSKIKYVFETHFHADFISGHLTLSNLTGAKIVFGPKADPSYPAIIAEDNQVFEFGDISLTALHTPGHTLESTSYLLKDNNGTEQAIFTGDTLFLGDVGIPDVAQRYRGLSKEDLAELSQTAQPDVEATAVEDEDNNQADVSLEEVSESEKKDLEVNIDEPESSNS